MKRNRKKEKTGFFAYRYRGFSVARLVLTFSTAAMLAAPWPLAFNNILTFSNTWPIACKPGAEAQQIVMNSTSPALGGSIFSKLSSVQLASMPINVCLNNRNKIYLDGVEHQSHELLDGQEGGAMAVRFSYVSNSTPVEIYARKDETKCITLEPAFGKVLINNNIELRNVYPAGSPKIIETEDGVAFQSMTYSNATIDTINSSLSYQTIFSVRIFVVNFILCLFGVILLYLGIIKIIAFLRPSTK